MEVEQLLSSRKLAPKTDLEFATALVNAHLLTPFQAESLIHSRTRGLRLGHFKILTGLFRGGMGEIYAARMHGSDELFALKALRPELRTKSRSLLRFELESFALASISSESILRFVHSGWAEDVSAPFPYIVTELVQGPNLQELVAIRGGLPWQQACDVICQAADGLAAAHAAGFIHRDVKPSNIVISRSGIAKLIDFGLALYLGDADRFRTLSNRNQRKSIGTTRFSAPEQFVDANAVGPQADVYALGATLLYALTGKLLPAIAPSSPGELALSILDQERSHLPEVIRNTVCSMLARSPAERLNCPQQAVAPLRELAKRYPVEVDFDALVRSRSSMTKQSREITSKSRSCELPITRDLSTNPDVESCSTKIEVDAAVSTQADSDSIRSCQFEGDITAEKCAEIERLEASLLAAHTQFARAELDRAQDQLRTQQELARLQLQLNTSLQQIEQIQVESRAKDKLVECSRVSMLESQEELAAAVQQNFAQKTLINILNQQLEASQLAGEAIGIELELCRQEHAATRERAIAIAAQVGNTNQAILNQLAEAKAIARLREQEIADLLDKRSAHEASLAQKNCEVERLTQQMQAQQDHTLNLETNLRAEIEQLKSKFAEKSSSDARDSPSHQREVLRTLIWGSALELQLDSTTENRAELIDADFLHELSEWRMVLSEPALHLA